MSMKANRVAHFESGTSDKVYMACVREVVTAKGEKSYEVLGKWGRRGKKFSSQVKGSFESMQVAMASADDLFRGKLAEGYVDIESGSYRGSLTLNEPEVLRNLESESDVKSAWTPVPKKAKPEPEPMLDPRTMVAVCVDNSGMEDRFDVGTSYVFETVQLAKKGRETAAQPAKKGMVWVFDKLGKSDEYLLERFRFVKEE